MDKGTVIIGVLTVVVIAGIILASGGSSSSGSIEGVQDFSRTDRTHTNEDIAYDQTPPVGGAHTPTWIDCNAASYESPVDTNKAVHALEHGAVWISYDPKAVATSSVRQLESYLDNYSFLSPVPNQPAPIKLSVWGKQLAVDTADDERIQQFLDTYRQGPQTPEPGASCEPPNGPMEQQGQSHEHDDVNHYHDDAEKHQDDTKHDEGEASGTSTDTGTTTQNATST